MKEEIDRLYEEMERCGKVVIEHEGEKYWIGLGYCHPDEHDERVMGGIYSAPRYKDISVFIWKPEWTSLEHESRHWYPWAIGWQAIYKSRTGIGEFVADRYAAFAAFVVSLFTDPWRTKEFDCGKKMIASF